MDNPKSFAEGLPIIDAELKKRAYKWKLTAISYMDYEDVSQIIRIHINNKWSQYDNTRPFRPWINTIISSQIKNILRNVYWNFERPCLRCIYNLGDTSCGITPSGIQCAECPLYKKWAKTKKSAHDIKLAVSMENHEQEVHNRFDDYFDTEKESEKLNKKLQEQLRPNEWKIYRLLYIEHKSENEVAKLMGFRTGEKNRSPGYKRLRQVIAIVLARAKKILEEGLD